MKTDVVVVGGGIAGLSTAYELHRRGISFTVLERASRPGGVIFSEDVEGYVIDAGPDALLVQKPEAIRLCEELGLGERLVSTKPPRLAFVQRGGALHPLPAASVLGIPTRVGPFLRTQLFSWPGKLRMGAELFVPRKPDEDDESIGAFMTRRFGREATTYLAEPLLAGIHAGDVDRLSLLALFPRFAEAERTYGSLLRAFRQQGRRRAGKADRRSSVLETRERDRASASTNGIPGTAAAPGGPNGGGAPRASDETGAFRSLAGGLNELVCGVVAALPAGSVQTGMAVTRVTGRDPLVVETAAGAAIACRALVLSTPAYVTASLIGDLDGEIARLAGQIPYASIATVALAFSREAIAHPLNGSGYVVPRVEANGISAATWLSSKWPHRAPEGRVLLRTFIGGTRDPEAFRLTDADLVARSMSAIRSVLGIRGEPLLRRVYRFERANAQHEVGHLARVAAIERALGAHPGLFMTGSGLRGVGIPDCVADGRVTATQVADWLGGERSHTQQGHG